VDLGQARGRSTAARAAVRRLWRGGDRLLLFVTASATALVALQLLRLLAEAAGWCTGCNVGSDGDILAATTVGGGAAAWGGDDEPLLSDRVRDWIDGLFGDERPEPGVEGMDQPLPANPAFDQPADVEAIRGSLFYEAVTDDDSTLNEFRRSVYRFFGKEPAPPDVPQPDGPPPGGWNAPPPEPPEPQ